MTRNSGSEFAGYSRLDDGDLQTYWKSNPYLTSHFTGESDELHPQWVVIRLADAHAINALRVAWGQPYARDYRVQYWSARSDAMENPDSGHWTDFPQAALQNGQGGMVTLRLAPEPMAVGYVRVLMTRSSNTCDTHGANDLRNCVGYAIRELYLGTMKNGHFHDILHHAAGQEQTFTYCSSVDPWHRASDVSGAPGQMESGDQVGLDLLYRSGLTRNLPAMIPVAILYGTPDDAAAELRYLERRHAAISGVELGEEPDGQYIAPEDYAALYVQWARALHAVDPALKLGGPSFQGGTREISFWADESGESSWLKRFLAYLRSHHAIDEFGFLSFEHYPYYDGTCQGRWSNLFIEPEVLMHIVDVWRNDGLAANVPIIDAETNAPGGDAAVDVFGALWLAETFPAFLTAGGDASYYHHALPYSTPHPACLNSWGTYRLFTTGEDHRILQPTAEFYAAQLLNREWVGPADKEHALYRAESDVFDAQGRRLVTAYPVRWPDGRWAVLLINKDKEHAHDVHVVLRTGLAGQEQPLPGPLERRTFGSAQYQWHPAMHKGYADPNQPPVVDQVEHGDQPLTLPPASITLLRSPAAPH